MVGMLRGDVPQIYTVCAFLLLKKVDGTKVALG